MSSSLLTVSPAVVGLAALLIIDPGFSELRNFAPTIVLVFVVIWGVIKLAPTWKEVKMREMDIREKEVAQRETQSIAIQTLAESTRDIALEQRHATEALRIAERVNIREGEKLTETVLEVKETVQRVVERVEQMEARTAEARA